MSAIEGTSVLAFVTTVHCALLILLRHRMRLKNGTSLVLLPSIAAVVSPWFLMTPAWLVAIVIVHIIWFITCEPMAVESNEIEKARPVASAAKPSAREHTLSVAPQPQ